MVLDWQPPAVPEIVDQAMAPVCSVVQLTLAIPTLLLSHLGEQQQQQQQQ
jgi:hypothetical protein